jgi:hypothetical protein
MASLNESGSARWIVGESSPTSEKEGATLNKTSTESAPVSVEGDDELRHRVMDLDDQIQSLYSTLLSLLPLAIQLDPRTNDVSGQAWRYRVHLRYGDQVSSTAASESASRLQEEIQAGMNMNILSIHQVSDLIISPVYPQRTISWTPLQVS